MILTPAELLPAVSASRATVLFGVPSLYRALLGHPLLDTFDLSSLRCCVSAAEPLPPEVADEWHRRTILDGLGTTELTHVFVSARRGRSRPGVIDTAVDGYETRVVDDAFEPLPDGTPGRLAVRGLTGTWLLG